MTLDDLQKLCDEATPGICWVVERARRPLNSEICAHDWVIVPSAYQRETDQEFIAAARTYLPKLIAVARAAKDLCHLWGDVANAVESYGALCPEWRPAERPSLKETLAALEAP